MPLSDQECKCGHLAYQHNLTYGDCEVGRQSDLNQWGRTPSKKCTCMKFTPKKKVISNAV